MRKILVMLMAAGALGACTQSESGDANEAVNAAEPKQAALTLTRLDCGTATIKDFDGFFSDKPGLWDRAPACRKRSRQNP